MYKFTCKYCGKTFFAKNSTAKYCSTSCRVMGKRKRDRETAKASAPRITDIRTAKPEEPKRPGRVSADSISLQVASAHGMVAFFDNASLNGPDEMRSACGHIARGFEATLEEIGL